MKQHIYLKNGYFFYGSIDEKSEILDETDLTNKLNRIPVSSVKFVHFNSKTKKVLLEHDKNLDTESILLIDSKEWVNLSKQIFQNCPNAQLLDREKTHLQLIKKPLIAILILVVIVLLISYADPNEPLYTSRSRSMYNMFFKGLKSLGMDRVILIFGSIMLVPALSILFRLKNARYNKSIRLQ